MGLLASRGIKVTPQKDNLSGNIVVFSATTADQVALPYSDKKHGMFTYFLLKKLQETVGNVTLQELGDYITENVKQQSLLLNNKAQTPCVTPSSSLGTSWCDWKLKPSK